MLTHLTDEKNIGALLLIAFGVGAFGFFPETVAVSRYVFAAFLLQAVWRRRQRIRAQKPRRTAVIAAGILAAAIILSGTEAGAKIAIGGSFAWIGGVMLCTLPQVSDFRERVGIGAAGIAAVLLGITVFCKIVRLGLVESRVVFIAAAFAGAWSLWLLPSDRRKL